MKEITYIHFSDLHIGDQLAVPLLSHVKDELLSDLSFIKKQLGHVDIVFMTGDLVQTGAEKEFSEFEAFFDSLMQILSGKDENPVVIFVPGNHDLARTSEPTSSVHQVMKNWSTNPELRNDYFWNKDSEYIRYCEERFKYFDQFLRKYNNKHNLSPKYGLLPGDTYHTLNIKGVKIGVVGLNSSFLQIEGGNYLGKLGVYNHQITSLFDTHYVESLKSNDINFLLTHHNAEWFEPHSKSQYDGEIYKKNYVLEHFCGHNHIPKTSYHEDNFIGTSHVNVAPSLCGLEKFDDISDKIDRIHGYHAGKYQIEDDGSINKRLYPRIAVKRGGTFVFTCDQSYGLFKGSEYVDVRLRDCKVSNLDDEDSPANNIKDILSPSTKSGSDVKFHPVVLKGGTWYKGVRKQEQREAISILNSKRCLWVSTSFGLGEESFLHSIIRGMNVGMNSVFMVDCDEVTSVDDLKRLIREHFSMPLNNLIDELQSAYPQPVLIFSNISTQFAQRAFLELSDIASTVLHYNPKIKLVFVSSYVIPNNNQFASVTLSPLDIQDVRHYLDEALPDEEFTAVEVEKIHGLTNGYPMCLDIVSRNLAFASLDEMSDADFTFSNSTLNIPQATKDYIRGLKDSSQQDENKCYRLLLLLSILPKGDVFSSIKRFSSTSPFRMSEVSTLIERELITIDHYYVIKNSVLISQNKVLRVPKIYRDYILSLEDPDSLRLLYQSVCAMYLGDRWQSGEINLPKAHEDDYNPFFYYNLEAALSALLHHSIEQGDDAVFARYLKVAGNYVYKLSYQDMYYVALYVAKSFYQQVKDFSTIEGRSSLSFLKYQLAEAYRMNGQHNESIGLFKEVLEEKILNKSNLQSSRVSLGLIYLNKGDYENATFYADELLKGEKAKNTLNALTARYIKASFLRNKDKDLKELRSLYSALKKRGGQSIMLGNIAISIGEAAPSAASLKLLESESKNQKTIYTWMRVTLRRVSMYLLPQFSKSLNDKDIEAVKKVYSFSFSQMLMPMVNTAHDILWNHYFGRSDYLQLLTLLRHSIYAWELNGLKDKSSSYVQHLLNDSGFMEWARSYKGNNSETRALLENLTLDSD